MLANCFDVVFVDVISGLWSRIGSKRTSVVLEGRVAAVAARTGDWGYSLTPVLGVRLMSAWWKKVT